MKSVLGFVSTLAVGLLAAGAVTVVGRGGQPGELEAGLGMAGPGFAIDPRSLLLGLTLGLVLATLARISWAELPRRIVLWLLANERNFYRMGWAALLIGVLLFY